MKQTSTKKFSTHLMRFAWIATLLIMLVSLAAPQAAMAQTVVPSIASDKLDYAPGELVTLTGQNWQGDAQVRIVVDDDGSDAWILEADSMVSPDGSFVFKFNIAPWFIASYNVKATGLTTGRVAYTSFTDLAIGDYSQCANDDGDGYNGNPGECEWIGGNVNANKATLSEGDSNVQRLWLIDLAPGSTHTMTFDYGTTKGGKHAYDFLTSWDWSEDWITLADLCLNITGCETASVDYIDIPQDPNVPNHFEPSAPGDRQFMMRGGNMTAVSTPVIFSGSYTGDSDTRITITFTVDPSGPMCSNGTCGVGIWFAGHIARTADWVPVDGNGGAGNIPGSPYHVMLAALDGSSIGSRDNQMAAGAVVDNGNITIIKNAIPDDAQNFEFSLTGLPNFFLDDDADATLPNTRSFILPPGIYTVAELAGLQNWNLTSIVCVDPTSNTTVDLVAGSAAINLASAETVTCTFTNGKSYQNLTATKTAVPTFNRVWDWTIVKDYDATYNLFAGGSVTHGYKVSVTPVAIDSGWKVNGVITINNPNDIAFSANVADAVNNGGTCVVASATVNVPATGSVNVNYECTYASAPSPLAGTNTATVSWSQASYSTPAASTTATAAFVFDNATAGNPSETNPVITVDDNNLTGENWSANRAYVEWNYSRDFACSTNPQDYINGVYSYSLTNTATITQTNESDTAKVDVNCYAPVVSKTAAGVYTEDHDWTITKSVNPASQKQIAGSLVNFTWQIDVVESIVESGFAVSGNITVQNPAPSAMTVSLVDVLNDGSSVVIGTCSNGATFAAGSLTIPANVTTVCGYSATPAGRSATLNTVTATLNQIAFQASDPVEWTPTVLDGSVTIDDDQKPTGFPVVITDSGNFSYADSYTCSSNPADYAGDGTYRHSESNTATLASDDNVIKSSTATEVVDCYAPLVSKTAVGSYDERHLWDIAKSVDPLSQTGFAGNLLGWNWTVTVTETTRNENILVSGVITVANPAGSPGAMLVSLVDQLNDGTLAAVDCDPIAVGNQASINVASGASGTCAYTANPAGITATLNTATGTFNAIDFVATAGVTFNKSVVNDTAVVDDSLYQSFPLTISDSGTWSYPGSHLCSTDPAAYANGGSYTGSVTNIATVSSGGALQDQDQATTQYTCTMLGTIIVEKQTLPNGSSQSFTFTGDAAGSISDGGQIIVSNLAVGNYTSTELLPAGWDLTSIVCDDANSSGSLATATANFVLDAGEVVKCTFTNTQRGQIIVDKVTAPSGDPQLFEFDPSWGANFSLADATAPHNSGLLIPGSYSVVETNLPAGWVLTGAVCSDQSLPGAINLDPGETVTCTFTNKLAEARISINPPTATNKVNEQHIFTVKVEKNEGSGWVPVVGANPVVSILPNTYAPVADTCATTGTNANGECTVTINSAGANIYTANASATITVLGKQFNLSTNGLAGSSGPAVKTYVDARISINPPAATNKVGEAHTFTVLVEQNLGAGWAPVVGVSPVVSILPAGFSLVADTCPAGTLANGTCTVTINSAAAAVYTANATLTLNVLGESFNLATNGQAGSSGSAVKTYVDARISISPSAVNKVGEAHTFTVLVEQNLGAGWAPVVGVSPVVSILPAGFSLVADTCPAGTLANGTCTVTINSAAAAVYTANATLTLNVLGESFNLATNGQAGSSGPAVKTYVDARISINPPAATNKVGEAHTFTVKVEQNLGAGWVAVPGAKPVVSILPAGFSLVADNCAGAGTDANGQCTVIINSAAAAVYTANATLTLNVLGESFSLATNGQAGSSGSAVKTYVDARISIDPSAYNKVGDAHTFNIKVEKNEGSGWVAVAGVKPVVTILPAGFTLVSDGCVAGTNASGICSVVINSSVAAVYTANASLTLDVLGESFNLLTNGQAGSSGPAVKTYVAARIKIGPPTATNFITDPHTFTVTVEKNEGLGWVGVQGVKPAVSIVPAPGSKVDNCASTGTNASGQCTVVINSSVTGTFTANASVTLTLHEIEFALSTDGIGENSGSAIKIYVDGALEIEKIVIWNNVFPVSTKQFTICIKGPTFPLGTEAGACKVFDFDGQTQRWEHLKPGTYIMNELDPNGVDEWWVTTYNPISKEIVVPANDTGYGKVTNENTTLTAIQLKYFKVDWVKFQQVKLSWATYKEIDNIGFKLYRANVEDFTKAVELGFIAQVAPLANGERYYSFVDNTPAPGKYFYWLIDIASTGEAKTAGETIEPLSVQIFSNFIFLPGVSK